jgi:hypothetical protein
MYLPPPDRQEVALPSFNHLLGLHCGIFSPHRAEGKVYERPHVLRFLV